MLLLQFDKRTYVLKYAKIGYDIYILAISE